MPRANIEALSEGAGSKMIRKRKESNNDIYKIRAKMAISSKLPLKKHHSASSYYFFYCFHK